MYDIESVLDYKPKSTDKRRKSTMRSLIKWEGYGHEHNTWEPYNNVKGSSVFLEWWDRVVAQTTKGLATPKAGKGTKRRQDSSQHPHAQQSQVKPGWMATSTMRPIHYFLPASQPSPFCNDMLCFCLKSLIKQGSDVQLTYLPLPIQMSTANHDIGNTGIVGNTKAGQAALNHLGDL